MPTEIQILDTVYERLLASKENEVVGNLYGTIYEGKTVVLSYGLGGGLDIHEGNVVFPYGIGHIGSLALTSLSNFNDNDIASRLKEVQVTNNPVYILVHPNRNELEVFHLRDGDIVAKKFTLVTWQEFKERFIYLRLVGKVSLSLLDKRESKYSAELSKRISGMMFQVSKCQATLSQSDSSRSAQASTIGSLFDASPQGILIDHRSRFEVLEVKVGFPYSTIISGGEENLPAPHVIEMSGDRRKVVLAQSWRDFDCLCLVLRQRSLQDAYFPLAGCLEKFLEQKEINLKRNSGSSLFSYHFKPEELGHPISILLPISDSDDSNYRKFLHEFFDLEMKKPLFRRGCALDLKDALYTAVPLLNVHRPLEPAKLKGSNCKSAFTQGHYEYYHYMQQKFDDRGWGCAYRSLQTICSWFKLQGYSLKDVPSHQEIQKCLVECGDKKARIIGSNSWIGSLEVSYVLDHYLGVTSMIHSTSSGAELAATGPLLYDHFITHGTPVMIGGGELAHTIAGVSYDQDSQDIKFLIVDPHYTGEDELEKIYKKGGVAWKGMDFWKSGVFYNLCLPLRPQLI